MQCNFGLVLLLKRRIHSDDLGGSKTSETTTPRSAPPRSAPPGAATAGSASKVLRSGSAQKRSAILLAARELFLAEGFDRSSVDAVAARAKVSKRTVYDYFGDKQALLLAVVDETAESLMNTIRQAIDDDLSVVADLEQSLVTFSLRVAQSTLGSSDYVALMRLVTAQSTQLRGHWLESAPEDAIAGRFAELGRQGLLEVPDPRLAADHFIALTFLLIFNTMGQEVDPDDARVEQIITDGVRAFLRAYTFRP